MPFKTIDEMNSAERNEANEMQVINHSTERCLHFLPISKLNFLGNSVYAGI